MNKEHVNKKLQNPKKNKTEENFKITFSTEDPSNSSVIRNIDILEISDCLIHQHHDESSDMNLNLIDEKKTPNEANFNLFDNTLNFFSEKIFS